MIQRRTQKEDAVSPVVGVMLMLVVTIVIAAVVAAFATGIAGDTKATPIATFGVASMTLDQGYLQTVTLINKGGDLIQATDIDVALKCDGSTVIYTLLGHEYNDGKNLDNMTVTNSPIAAGDVITLTRYKKASDDAAFALSRTGFAKGKSVDFTISDKETGNLISGSSFIVS